MVNVISTLFDVGMEARKRHLGVVPGKNGYLYFIPSSARQVAKFNPVNKSITYIGPDLGYDDMKWRNGAVTDSGVIYCPPYGSDSLCGILKIDTNTDTVTELDRNLLPERGFGMWRTCATAIDGCIYFMPHDARRIMKLDPNNNDATTSVGDDLGEVYYKYNGTVVGIDGCVYGIPFNSKRIIKYDPINDTTSFVGEEADRAFDCSGGGALGRDGCIYAITDVGQVLKIDTANNVHYFVGTRVESYHDDFGCDGFGWGDTILGIDGCIYSPPVCARRILKYDPHSDQTSLVGDDFNKASSKWYGGSLASDGVIYCSPFLANFILSIDPWKEYISSLQNNMVQHPEQLGCIFKPNDDMLNETNFDRAVTKFGYKKVLKALEACMHPADQVCAICNLYPFMIAASFNSSDLSVIYHLLRQVPPINC